SLATHKYPGTVYPEGFAYLSKFILAPFPLWVYQAGDFTVKKKVFMVHNSNTTCVLYEIRCRREGALLRITPLVNARSFHGIMRTKARYVSQKDETDGIKLESSNGFAFWLTSNLKYHSEPKWYYNFEYDLEKERGLAFLEDIFNPGYFES